MVVGRVVVVFGQWLDLNTELAGLLDSLVSLVGLLVESLVGCMMLCAVCRSALGVAS